MLEAIGAVIVSAYGLTGVLFAAVIALATRQFYLDRGQLRLEAELKETQQEMKEHMTKVEKHSKERAESTDEKFDSIETKLDSIVNWAISTDQGDTDWLKGQS